MLINYSFFIYTLNRSPCGFIQLFPIILSLFFFALKQSIFFLRNHFRNPSPFLQVSLKQVIWVQTGTVLQPDALPDATLVILFLVLAIRGWGMRVELKSSWTQTWTSTSLLWKETSRMCRTATRLTCESGVKKKKGLWRNMRIRRPGNLV